MHKINTKARIFLVKLTAHCIGQRKNGFLKYYWQKDTWSNLQLLNYNVFNRNRPCFSVGGLNNYQFYFTHKNFHNTLFFFFCWSKPGNILLFPLLLQLTILQPVFFFFVTEFHCRHRFDQTISMLFHPSTEHKSLHKYECVNTKVIDVRWNLLLTARRSGWNHQWFYR